MALAHVALWTRNLDGSAAFWQRLFGATIAPPYRSERRPGFVSVFATLPGDALRLELMAAPWLADAPVGDAVGWDHVAISLGNAAAVDALATLCASEGCLLSAPRKTGDGFYEAVIATPDGTRVEVTA